MAIFFPFKQILVEGYDEQISDNVLRTTFANGTSEERPIMSRIEKIITARYLIKDKSDYDLMEQFYIITRQGILPFEWVDKFGQIWLAKLLAPHVFTTIRACENNFKGFVTINIKLLERL